MFRTLFRSVFGSRRAPIRSGSARPASRRRRGADFCPRLESLEDRTVLSTVATHFQVVTPHSDHVNEPAEVEVIALDASNHQVANYSGLVKLTNTGGAPLSYRFTPHDHGSHSFTVTPKTVHPLTITATDAGHRIAGKASLDVTPAAATHFLVVVDSGQDGGDSESGDSTGSSSAAGTAQAVVGAPVRVEVIALDASNNVVPSYTGTVQLSSTDAATTLANGTALPASYTFTAADEGEHAFTILPGTVGSETLTATDSANSLTGSATLNVSAAPVATQIHVEISENVQPGQPAAIEVKVLDASGNVVPNYTGTIQLTSSDSGATLAGGTALPASYTFTAADEGEHVFLVTFAATGSQTITLTDAANNLSATVTVNVGASSGQDSTDGSSCPQDSGSGTTTTGAPAVRHHTTVVHHHAGLRG